MRSIQRRLSVGLFAVLLVVGLVLAQTGLWLFDQGLRRYFAGNLREEAENLLVAMVRGPNGMQLDEQRLNLAFQRPYSGRYFVIELERTPGAHAPCGTASWKCRTRKGWCRAWSMGPRSSATAGVPRPLQAHGPEAADRGGAGLYADPESFARVQWMGLGAGALALLLVLLLQRLTVRRSLRPLEEVRLQIAQLQQASVANWTTRLPRNWSRWWSRSTTCWRTPRRP